MPLQATSGAASYDGFGGGVAAVPNYIEDVFSTYLYTGNDTYNTINNGIDLAGKGGLVWLKRRDVSSSHVLVDTARGATKSIFTNNTNSQSGGSSGVVNSFNSNGFTLWVDNFGENVAGASEVSWTFRKQPKFFDVVTYTGDDNSNHVIPHNLGSVPGCIIVKQTSGTGGAWFVRHRSVTNIGRLNLTNSFDLSQAYMYPNLVTDTSFAVNYEINTAGETYVAYLFAHNAGGFGLTGTDNVISCGSYTGTSTVGNEINVGFEPQFIIIKRATGTAEHWQMFDNMRGIATGGNDAVLYPSLSNAEYAAANAIGLTATGFKIEGSGLNVSGDTYIYIAIRRGPMKVPTDATKVFAPVATTANSSTTTGYSVTAGFPVDLSIFQFRNASFGSSVGDRLRGISNTAGSTPTVYTYSTSAESNSSDQFSADNMTGIKNYGYGPSYNLVNWMMRRAPGFFDEVCYTGDGNQPRQLNHNLSVVPEFIICKSRSNAADWIVYYGVLGKYLKLNTTDAGATSSGFWPASYPPTSSTFNVGDFINWSGQTFVAYLFASCAGVSKVGSYTGTGTTQQINCGFIGGARFVMIKRTDSTGDWYVWDSARGIVAGNDPYLLLNSTAAEVTTTDYIDTYSAGFEISSTAPAAINASGGTFIFLAIA